uniref:histidine kinase n=1 Tax=Tetraselmis cordiformis TaxID=426497 RepID=A0A0K1H4Q2_9CHLO|nr:phytochrome [Tetraselmis cordiformis]
MLRPSRDEVWQDAQNLADLHLESHFRETAGTVETSARADGYGYHAGSQLLKAGREGTAPEVAVLKDEDAAAGRAAGIPVKSISELRAYGERVLRPGQVQAFGAVILMSLGHDKSMGPRGTIQAASANAKAILGVDARALLDTDLLDVSQSPFDQATIDALKQVFDSNDPNAQAPAIIATLTRRPGSRNDRAYVIVHTTKEGGVIDVEPISGSVDSMLQGSLQTHTLARSSVSRLQDLNNATIRQLCQAMAKETAILTGYDRVMLYEFQPDMHGHVVAEVMSAGVCDSMLDLHFPATDIPQANRNIFMNMRSRMIANVGAPSVQVVQSPCLNENIILAGSQLRGVSGCHAQYLQNMGVQATLVLSIVIGSRDRSGKGGNEDWVPEEPHGRPQERSPLWGLLVCHHYTGPHRVDYDHRSAVEFLAKVFALQLNRSLDAEFHAMKQRVVGAQSAVCGALRSMEDKSMDRAAISTSLAHALMSQTSGDVMLRICEATGCAMLLEGKWHTVGQCPDQLYLKSLAKWLRETSRLMTGQFGTISLLGTGYPDALATKATMAGVLVADLGKFGEIKDSFGLMIWMRGEMIQEETWAGDKHMPQARAKGAEMSPRASFKAMKELVQYQARPWASVDVDGIQAIQLLLQDTIRLHIEGQITSRIMVTLNQERLRNMDELSKVASELRSVISSADLPIVRVDADLNIISCNFAAEPFMAPAEQVAEKPFTGFLDPECRTRVQAILKKALDTGDDPPRFQITLSNNTKEDTGTYEALVLCHLKRNIFGQLEELVLVFRDVTVQTELMARVAARERDIMEVVQSSMSPIFSVDVSGRVTEWNYAMERLTGELKAGVLNKLAVGEVFSASGRLQIVSSMGSSDAATEMSALLVLALGEGASEPPEAGSIGLNDINFSFLKRLDPTGDRAANAKQIDVSMLCRPRFGPSDEIVGAFFFIQDLTVPNALEKAIAVQTAAEAAAESKTRHIAFLCHEIRNPVNGILATVQAMEEMMSQKDNEKLDVCEMFDLVKTTMACTDQLRRTVDGILDINKLEEEKLDVVTAPFTIPSMLRTVVSQVVKASEEKGLSLECEVSPELIDVSLNGDEGRIQQVLANFCWNSVKFTSNGGVKILVESEPSEKTGFLRVFFKVVDTGKGMDQKTQESLFQRYAMGQHRVGKYGGSGLGLSICRSLAELMKGHVHCVSVLGQGSTFVLELELELDAEEALVTSSASGRDSTSTKNHGTVRKGRVKDPAPDSSPPQGSVPAPSTHLHPAVSANQGAMSAQAQPPAPAASQLPSSTGFQQHYAPQFSGYPTPPSPMRRQQAGNPIAQASPPRFHASEVAHHLDVAAEWSGSWNMRAIRESVFETSVGVLVEVELGGARRQQWGGAPISRGNVAAALTAAHEDAMQRVAALYQPAGLPSPIAAPVSFAQQQMGPYGYPPIPVAPHPVMWMPPPMHPSMAPNTSQYAHHGMAQYPGCPSPAPMVWVPNYDSSRQANPLDGAQLVKPPESSPTPHQTASASTDEPPAKPGACSSHLQQQIPLRWKQGLQGP